MPSSIRCCRPFVNPRNYHPLLSLLLLHPFNWRNLLPPLLIHNVIFRHFLYNASFRHFFIVLFLVLFFSTVVIIIFFLFLAIIIIFIIITFIFFSVIIIIFFLVFLFVFSAVSSTHRDPVDHSCEDLCFPHSVLFLSSASQSCQAVHTHPSEICIWRPGALSIGLQTQIHHDHGKLCGYATPSNYFVTLMMTIRRCKIISCYNVLPPFLFSSSPLLSILLYSNIL